MQLPLNKIFAGFTAWALLGAAAMAAPVAVWRFPATVRATLPFEAELHVSWAGEQRSYVAQPTVFDAPEGATVELHAVEVSADAPEAAVLRFVITASEPGALRLPELRVGLLEATADTATLGEAPSPAATLTVPAQEIAVLGPPIALGPVYLAAAGVLVLAVLGAVWVQRRRVKSRRVAEGPVPLDEQVQAKLHAARRLRLDGDFYHFYRALADAAGLLAQEPETHALAAKLQMQAQQAGYSGVRPHDDDMNSHVRDVERALTRYREERRP
jgi:hypothetical protein